MSQDISLKPLDSYLVIVSLVPKCLLGLIRVGVTPHIESLIYLFRLHQVLVASHKIIMQDFSWQHRDSLVVVHGLSCSTACGILVPQPGIEPVSPALQGRFLPLDHQGSPHIEPLVWERQISETLPSPLH